MQDEPNAQLAQWENKRTYRLRFSPGTSVRAMIAALQTMPPDAEFDDFDREDDDYSLDFLLVTRGYGNGDREADIARGL